MSTFYTHEDKQSGNGREKEKWGLEEFLEVKAILGNQK